MPNPQMAEFCRNEMGASALGMIRGATDNRLSQWSSSRNQQGQGNLLDELVKGSGAEETPLSLSRRVVPHTSTPLLVDPEPDFHPLSRENPSSHP